MEEYTVLVVFKTVVCRIVVVKGTWDTEGMPEPEAVVGPSVSFATVPFTNVPFHPAGELSNEGRTVEDTTIVRDVDSDIADGLGGVNGKTVTVVTPTVMLSVGV